jgi:glycosyltransferase involved in cell wall biosynthesis
VRVLQLVSCRGWSSDAYWAARASVELARRGHAVTLGYRAGTEAAVADRARAEGVERLEAFRFAGGLRPRGDVRDARALAARWAAHDVVHVHRGKEHWLAAVVNRLTGVPRPLVRTRHIAQAVRPHAANRWLYGRATAAVVCVTEAIRGQLLAAGLGDPRRAVTLHGGADVATYAPRPADAAVRARLGAAPDVPLVGMVGGLRVMKGHAVVVDALARLAAEGLHPRVAMVGRGPMEAAVRRAVAEASLEGSVVLTGFAPDLPAVLAALDVALYVPLESDGMSRVLFETLAAGRALVAARVGAVPEVLRDDEHALLVPAGEAPAIAAALRRLLAEPATRARLGAAGRRLVEAHYSGARLAEALEARYAALGAA